MKPLITYPNTMGDEMVKCKICGAQFKWITHTHLRKHGVSLEEYRLRYGNEAMISQEIRDSFSKIHKGKKMGSQNPAYRKEVRGQISNTVKERWEEGAYESRINGMSGKYGKLSPRYEPEKHTPTLLARNEYVNFLSEFQDVSTCSRCGETKHKMNIHHIDEDHDNFLISNLEPLCVPCHCAFHYKREKRPFISIGKTVYIDAAHYLPDYEGACANCHGHRWQLDVELQKRIDPSTGMVVDFGDLKELITIYVLNALDHNLINNMIANPTGENMVVWIWERLMFDALLKGINKISLWETETSKIELDKKGMLSIFTANIEDYLSEHKKMKPFSREEIEKTLKRR